MKQHWYIFVLAALFAMSLACPLPLRADQHARVGHRPAGQPQARPERRPPLEANRPPLPPRWMERVQKMSPQEQERFLANNRRFQNLPPKRQAQLRALLKTWNNLTPAQKEAFIRQERIFERLTPDQKREVRGVILPQWRQLPPARKAVLVDKLRRLQGLTDQERERRVQNPKFGQGLSPEEWKLLREMARLKVGPGGNR